MPGKNPPSPPEASAGAGAGTTDAHTRASDTLIIRESDGNAQMKRKLSDRATRFPRDYGLAWPAELPAMGDPGERPEQEEMRWVGVGRTPSLATSTRRRKKVRRWTGSEESHGGVMDVVLQQR